MEQIWLKSYPPGVPAKVDVGAYRSIGELFDATVARYGPRAAFTNMGKAISYDELDILTGCFAGYLQGVLQLSRCAGRLDDAQPASSTRLRCLAHCAPAIRS